jgi:nifR3 family TIM-barrel protein
MKNKVTNKVTIGNIELENNIFLAPMAGVTDKVFRVLCRQMGCGLVYTEMVSAKGIMHNNHNTQKLLEIDPLEMPAAVQLFGSDPVIMGKMAEKLSENDDIAMFDINMGCPAPKIVKNGEGSALLQKPDLIGEIVKAVSQSTSKPVTVKMRRSFDGKENTCIKAAEIAALNGAAAVTIHGRTREQYYSGKADWDIIKEVKSNLDIPVIGNGDITSPESAKAMLDYTGCDAVMIGRAAEGNPWIFKRVVTYLQTGELIPEPNFKERLDMARKHLDMLVAFKGEHIGVCEMRKHLGWYIKGLPHCAEMRVVINTAATKERMHEVIDLIEVKADNKG